MISHVSQHLMEQIEVVTEHSKILLLDNGETPLIFAYTTMENSTSSTTGSIDFNEFKGVNITEFLLRNKIDPSVNNQGFLTSFMTYLTGRKPMTVKLHKDVQYASYGN